MDITHSRMVDWVEGAINLRDFGGYPTEHGRRMRHGLLFRSGTTHGISREGLTQLAEYLGIRTVFDLRTEHERERGLSPFEDYGIRVLHEPLDPGMGVNPGAPTAELLGGLARGELDWLELYWSLIQYNGPRFARILETLAQPGMLPALIHCTGGRDRTGVTVALVQAALGVSESDIAEDYSLSGALLERAPASEFERLFSHFCLSRQEIGRIMLTRPETMHLLFSRIRNVYGDVRCLLWQCGVDDATIDRLRAAVC
jgi:protein-tyrosine phosphatase